MTYILGLNAYHADAAACLVKDGTLVGQRVFGIALGYEDLNDHDQLRHDPMMAILAGKLEARRVASRSATSSTSLSTATTAPIAGASSAMS